MGSRVFLDFSVVFGGFLMIHRGGGATGRSSCFRRVRCRGTKRMVPDLLFAISSAVSSFGVLCGGIGL